MGYDNIYYKNRNKASLFFTFFKKNKEVIVFYKIAEICGFATLYIFINIF
jgi:hypothetical protein